MEFLNGGSLQKEIAESGPFPIERVFAIVLDVASALELAHAHGFVHGDLKPANVVGHHYETGERIYKIIDFGISTRLMSSDATTHRTLVGDAAMSVPYASPEQLNGDPLDARSDIYSLGAVVYEMLTAHRLFEARDAQTLFKQKLTSEPPTPSTFR